MANVAKKYYRPVEIWLWSLDCSNSEFEREYMSDLPDDDPDALFIRHLRNVLSEENKLSLHTLMEDLYVDYFGDNKNVLNILEHTGRIQEACRMVEAHFGPDAKIFTGDEYLVALREPTPEELEKAKAKEAKRLESEARRRETQERKKQEKLVRDREKELQLLEKLKEKYGEK